MILRIFLFFLCFDVGLTTVGAALGINLCEPAGSCTPYPHLYNATNPNQSGTLVGNLTSTNNNSTGGNIFNGLKDLTGAYWYVQMFVNFITGGFIINVISHISGVSMPTEMIQGIQVIVGFLLSIWLIYMFTGRFASGGTP